MNFDIIKAKLLLGGNMNGGELKLVVAEMVQLMEKMEDRINELQEELTTLAARSSGGSRKNSKTAEVRPDEDK